MNQLKSKLVSFLFVCVVVFAVAPAMAAPSPFRDPFAADESKPAAAQPAQPVFSQAVTIPASQPKASGGGRAPAPKAKEATPAPSSDCPFGQAEVPEGEDPRCLTAKEWKEAEVKEATEKGKIEGASSARFWGWFVAISLCFGFTAFSLWMWFGVIRPRLDRFAGALVKFRERIEELEKRAEDLEGGSSS